MLLLVVAMSFYNKHNEDITAYNTDDAEYYINKAEDYLMDIEYYTAKGDLYNAKIYSRYYEYAIDKCESIMLNE